MHRAWWAWLTRMTPLRLALGVAIIFACTHLTIASGRFSDGMLSQQGFLHLLDLKALDLKFQRRHWPKNALPEPRVVIAAIDESSVDAFGLWPWDRRLIADFLTRVHASGARVIGFDAVFGDETPQAAHEALRALEADYVATGVTPQALAAARAEIARWSKRRQNETSQTRALIDAVDGFSARLRTAVGAQTPDEALAAAIKQAENTVLGYFTFYDEAEIVGLSDRDLARGFEHLNRSRVDRVYEATERNVGGQTVRVLKETATPLTELAVPTMVASLPPLPQFAAVARRFGYLNVLPDRDGLMRRMPLLNRWQNGLYPALSLALASAYLDAAIRPLNSPIEPGRALNGIGSLSPGELPAIPTDAHSRLLINHYADPATYFPTISVKDILSGDAAPEQLKDKVVIFGLTAIGLDIDLVPTSFSPRTPGVYLHAMALQNLLDGIYLQRWFGIALIEALAYLVVGIFFGLAVPRLPAWGGVVAAAGLLVTFFWLDVSVIFPRGIWVLNVLPTLQVVTTLLAVNLYGFLTEGRQKREVRRAFQFYLNSSVVEEVLKDPSRLKLGGDRRVCTVLFSDIRGFTNISEKLSPEALSNLLNEYLTPMTECVFNHHGTLDKYMGDAIMAIYGAPIADGTHATQGCYSALDMLSTLDVLQKGWRERGLPQLDVGIGLNTGPMSVGNMGSEMRFDYTVMGDHVNLGSRLEGLNKQYGSRIIISAYTREAAGSSIHTRALDLVRVKGKQEPVEIFELVGRDAAPEEAEHWIEAFEEGLAAYREQRWDAALARFTTVQEELKPGDLAAELYIKRCHEMKMTPPGRGWDGVFTMTSK